MAVFVAEVAVAGAVLWEKRTLSAGEGPRAERTVDVRGVDDGDGEAGGVVGLVRRVGEAGAAGRWDEALDGVEVLRGAAEVDGVIGPMADRAEVSVLAAAGRTRELDGLMDGVLAGTASEARIEAVWGDYVRRRLVMPDGVSACRARLEKASGELGQRLKAAYWRGVNETLMCLGPARWQETLALALAVGDGESPALDRVWPGSARAIGLAAAEAKAKKPALVDAAMAEVERRAGLGAEKATPGHLHVRGFLALHEGRAGMFADEGASGEAARFWAAAGTRGYGTAVRPVGAANRSIFGPADRTPADSASSCQYRSRWVTLKYSGGEKQ